MIPSLHSGRLCREGFRASVRRPRPSAGGTRRYSADDVERMRRIADLQADGLHLSGIGRVIDLEDQNEALRKDLAEAREERGGDDGGDPAE
ncbi:MerR family transcriptional regulator [Leifsonia aquatica]|uniref:MerR family transcriptional regulator n=1 Tax=Leifsonia aquatica TaxID=144185 RepID=UPI00384E436D